LLRTFDWIQNRAPLIIHVCLPKVLELLYHDTHFRSQFETGTSGGAFSPVGRRRWESRVFFGAYDKAADAERVKYGTLNLLNDPAGMQTCAQYGRSILVLRQHVRERVTWTHVDSSYHSAVVGTLQFCAHVLHSMSNAHLTMILDVGSGRRSSLPSSKLTKPYYWEMQIVGPIALKRDVERIIIHPVEADVRDTAIAFAKINNCQLIFLNSQ
jgi:hypothetical protein